jgi:hypothetical protein
MTTTEYNGWTNYATWRVNLEMFDGQPLDSIDAGSDSYDVANDLRDLAHEYIHEQGSGLALDYALAFLSDVNWHEIAQHQIEAYREQDA